MNQSQTANALQHLDIQARSLGKLEQPKITLLGSLDDAQGTAAMGLTSEAPKVFLAIIYNGS